ncbi:peptidoglycan-binding protein [bacterium]|nr:MAG: peptidoglycan-binding protein [bacterium]
MARRVLLSVLAVVFVFALSGCATTRKNNELEMQGLRNQVSALESQLSAKDEEINSLKESSLKSSEMPAKAEPKSGEVKEHPKAKQIQTALKNAGYYQGAVDGKMGKGTREAIKAFQKANNIPADGKVGKKTWAVLKTYLEKKEK